MFKNYDVLQLCYHIKIQAISKNCQTLLIHFNYLLIGLFVYYNLLIILFLEISFYFQAYHFKVSSIFIFMHDCIIHFSRQKNFKKGCFLLGSVLDKIIFFQDSIYQEVQYQLASFKSITLNYYLSNFYQATIMFNYSEYLITKFHDYFICLIFYSVIVQTNYLISLNSLIQTDFHDYISYYHFLFFD